MAPLDKLPGVEFVNPLTTKVFGILRVSSGVLHDEAEARAFIAKLNDYLTAVLAKPREERGLIYRNPSTNHRLDGLDMIASQTHRNNKR